VVASGSKWDNSKINNSKRHGCHHKTISITFNKINIDDTRM
jgi:hypothetical protein